MWWYLLILLVISYPIAELSRLIVTYWNDCRESFYLLELTGMWLSFLVGIAIMARRLQHEMDS